MSLRRASIAEKSKSSVVDRIQIMMIAPKTSLEFSGNNDNQPVICKLRHPKSGSCALYMFTHENEKILELVKFEELRRSWLIGETVQKDGSLYIVSSVDAVFLILPYLSKASRFGKFMELECILEDSEYPECRRLACCSLEDLEFVADVKSIPGANVYRFNEEKTFSWLRLKCDRLVKALKQNCVDVSSGAMVTTYTRSNRTSTDEGDYLRYAARLLGEYLDEDLAKDFYSFIGVALEVEATSDVVKVEPPMAKKCKFDVLPPTEDYCEMNSTAVIKKTEKLTTAQKRLGQVDKSGIKSISSFFSPKTTKK